MENLRLVCISREGYIWIKKGYDPAIKVNNKNNNK